MQLRLLFAHDFQCTSLTSVSSSFSALHFIPRMSNFFPTLFPFLLGWMFGRRGRNICIGKALGRGGEFHGERILAIRLSSVGRMQMFMHDSGGRNVGRISSRYTRKRGWKQFPSFPARLLQIAGFIRSKGRMICWNGYVRDGFDLDNLKNDLVIFESTNVFSATL